MGIVLNGGFIWNLLNKIIISELELCLNNLYNINKMYVSPELYCKVVRIVLYEII